MSLARRQAAISCFTWIIVLAVFVGIFLTVGPAHFNAPENQSMRLFSVLIFVPGYAVTSGRIRRVRRGRRTGEIDERDEAVARQASVATLVIVAVIIYAIAIGLYTTHRSTGLVPVGWLYLLAYGTMGLVPLAHAAATLILDLRGDIDA